jgi:general secretion pathway protein F
LKDAKLGREIELLEDDLAKGTSLKEALTRRDLPPLYKRMVEAGARGNDLPGMLLLLADYYQRKNLLWTRFKGLMVYPILVLAVSLCLSIILALILGRFLHSDTFGLFFTQANQLVLLMWVPPVVFVSLLLALISALFIPAISTRLKWRLAGFREANLAQVASTMALILKSGTPLPDALLLVEEMEAGSPAASALARWRAQLAQGTSSSDWLAAPTPPFPPLFVWLVRQAREDLGAGFSQAASLYQSRAVHLADMLLYAALPVSTILLAQVVFWQVAPVIETLRNVMNAVGE